MQEKTTLARPYARAAFEQAQAEGRLREWSAMLAYLAAVVSDPRMRKLINHPKVGADLLSQLVIEICGANVAKGGQNFIKLLANAGRMAVAPGIHDLFERMRAQSESIAEVELVTAYELDEGQRKRLGEIVAKRVKRQVQVSTRVDGSIIGGVIIRSGDSVVDASVRGQLRQLGNDLAT